MILLGVILFALAGGYAWLRASEWSQSRVEKQPGLLLPDGEEQS